MKSLKMLKKKKKHIPTKKVKFNKYKHKHSKWMTYGIIKSITTGQYVQKTKNGTP